MGEGHRLYVEQAGNPAGVPVVWVHGGPGAGFGSSVLDLFDGELHRVVCYDQRAAGRSTPHAGHGELTARCMHQARGSDSTTTQPRTIPVFGSSRPTAVS